MPLQVLPEKVNNVIVENQVNTLPLITGKKSITYSQKQNDVNYNDMIGVSQANQYDPTSFSYQDPININQQFQYGY